jgi:outer membrane protein TolC
MKFKKSLLVLSIIIASGCSHIPEKEIESIRSTDSFVALIDYNYQYNLVSNYDRDELNIFVNNALRNNYDVNSATLTMISSLYQSRLTDTNRNPSFSASNSATKDRNFDSGVSSNTQYSTGISMSYEVDLWNRLKDERISKLEEFRASEEDRETVIISTIASLEESYFKMGYLSDSIIYTESSVDYYKEILKIAETRYKAGKTSYLDVLEAQRTVVETESKLKDLYIQSDENINLFLKLQGLTPDSTLEFSTTSLEELEFKKIPDEANFGLIENRPDVNAAYSRYISSYHDVEATRKSYLPTFKLTSNLGYSSNELSNLLQNPVGSIAANITYPFLNINEKKWNLAISQNELESRELAFHNTLLTAAHEVSNAINNYSKLFDKTTDINKSFELTKEISKINRLKYENGSVDITDWLTAEENERQAKMNVIQHNYNLVLAKITLYKALGGKI